MRRDCDGAYSRCGASGSPPPPGGNPFGGVGGQPSFPADSGNPYQSPSPFATIGASAGPITPGMLDISDVFSRTWTIFKREWGMCLVVILIVMGIRFAFNFVVGTGFNIAGAIAGGAAGRNEVPVLAISIMSIGNIVTALFGVWIQIGQTKYFLKVARGQPAEITEIFTGGRHFLPILGATILFGIVVFLGFVALIVPGVILSLMFSQYYYLILDRDETIIDSLKTSRELMKATS